MSRCASRPPSMSNYSCSCVAIPYGMRAGVLAVRFGELGEEEERLGKQGIGIGVVVAEARLEKLDVVAIEAQRRFAIAGAEEDVRKRKRLELLDLWMLRDLSFHESPRFIEIASDVREAEGDTLTRGGIVRLPVRLDRFLVFAEKLQRFGAMKKVAGAVRLHDRIFVATLVNELLHVRDRTLRKHVRNEPPDQRDRDEDDPEPGVHRGRRGCGCGCGGAGAGGGGATAPLSTMNVRIAWGRPSY